MLGKRYLNDGKTVVSLQDRQTKARSIFLKRMDDQYQLINVDCLCGHNYYETLSQKDRYGLPVTTVICKKCGIVYQNPRLCDDSLKDFYSTLYRDLYQTTMTPMSIPMFFYEQLSRGNRIANWLNKSNLFPEKVIEVGCGAGGILKAFQNKGVEAVGVDFDERYINYGRNKGLKLLLGSAEELPKHSADLVILSHVLEHFSDINKELETIRNLLSDKGHLYVELPGIFNLKPYFFDFLKSIQNAHNYYFTLGTLRQALGLYGWDLEDGNEKIFSLFKPIDHKIPISNSHYTKIMAKLNYYEKIRPIGQLSNYLSIGYLLQLGSSTLKALDYRFKRKSPSIS